MGSPLGTAMRFELFGPLRVWRDDSELALGPIQRRVVLAILLLHRNRPIGRQQIISAIWGDAAPASAVNLVHRHVSRLRQIIEPDRSPRSACGSLTWTDGGYLFTVPAGSVDLELFDAEVGAARTARARGDLAGAADALRRALLHSRGPLCDGLTGPFLDAQREGLTERHLNAVEELIDLDITLGNHLDAVAELRHLIAEHPLRERLRGLLMLALCRSDRQADALAAYQDTRRYLRDELGVEPGSTLRRLHQQVLTADPALTEPAQEPVPDGQVMLGAERDAIPVPAQLPHALPDFTGRDTELDRLNSLLPTADSTEGGMFVITAIAGMAGVGKTALALHWAHQIRERFPDGQLYVNLRGFDPGGPPMAPEDAVRGFLDALAIPPDQIPASIQAQAALYRSVLAGRRMLIVLDNACDADQVRTLLPGATGCLVVVTSRNQLTSLAASDGAHPLVVDLLPPAEARQLLVRRIGRHRVDDEPDAAADILAFCAGLPLALSIVAARAATNPHIPLDALAAELSETEDCLNAFDAGDQTTNVRAVFSWSYQRLSPPAARLFRLLGLHSGPDAATAAIASLAGVALSGVRPLLAELRRTYLVIERLPGRFTCHDLLRAYARELADGDSADDRGQAIARSLDHYLHSAHRADQLLRISRDDSITPTPPQSLVAPEKFTDHRRAMAWFTSEHTVLLAALRFATERGFDVHAWQLAWTLTSYLDRRGHWQDAATTQQAALRCATRLGDPYAQAVSHGCLAYAYIRLSLHEEAIVHLVAALSRYEQLGDHAGQAHAHRTMTWVLDQQGRYRQALPHARQAFELFGVAGHPSGQARALNAMGWFHTQLGEYEDGLRYCHRALDLHREIDDRFGQADTLDSIGRTHHQLGHHREAAAYYHQALALYREFEDRYNEADTLGSLGDTLAAEGDLDSASTAWQAGLTILDDLDHPDADVLRTKLAAMEKPVSSSVADTRH
jgi:DNA-binding SARP family transcriptional activator/tetratricopeptide (TPR) repeat protein